jgi:sugar phosphate isomerase/epimerase
LLSTIQQSGGTKLKISLQLYTVRKYAQKNLYETLERIHTIGYNAIEAARIDFDMKTANILKDAYLSYGMETLSSQITYKKLKTDFSQIVSWLHSVNCGSAVVSVLPLNYLLKGAEGLKLFSRDLNILARKYLNEGIRLSYHHHDFEFLKFGDKRGFDILLSECEPELVAFVCDTYWAQRGGVSPASFIRSLKGRVDSIHMRDYNLVRSGLYIHSKDCPSGSGMLEIKEIINACNENGIRFISVEQNSSRPFEDIESSLKFLQTQI